MPKIVEGATDNLKVVATNAGGRVVPLPADTAVTASVATDTVSAVDPTAGTFTFTAGAVDGDDRLVAASASAGLTSAPYVETVVADNTPATLTIAPA